jgi:hypothetical protein
MVKSYYNNIGKVDQLLSNGHKVLSHSKQFGRRLGRVLFNYVRLSIPLSPMHVHGPTFLQAPTMIAISPRLSGNNKNLVLIKKHI